MKKIRFAAILSGIVLFFAGCGEREIEIEIDKLGVNGSGNDGDVMTINGIQCVLVKAGTFTMGENDTDYVWYSGPATQQATLTHDYWISKYPITDVQYNGSGTNNPVVNVTWFQADEWAKSKGGRLPTEAEWEFAARGGNNSKGYIYSGSDNLDEVGWYWDNWGKDNSSTHEAGRKQPNELGICDMSGNVWEWCNDRYGEYGTNAVTDPAGDSTAYLRVCRGGGWFNDARSCRVSGRGRYDPYSDYIGIGFRVVFPRN